MNVRRAILGMIALASIATASGAQAATFSIRSTDGAGEGLNDSTPFTPVGGNNATTLGQARMNVLNEAARIWGLLLQSNVPILVDAKFDPQTCSASSGTLGSAGPASVYRDFNNAPQPGVYYVGALANAIAGSRLASNQSSPDITATFNSSVDSDSACLGGRGFYYGFDHNRGTKFDLLLVVLHEFAHGLGFTSQVNLTTGQGFVSGGTERFDIYTYQLYDEQFGAAWPALTDAQRVQSALHNGSLAWGGANVNGQISRFSQGVTAGGRIRMYAPTTLTSGSSVSHFDTALTPNVLMEPNLPSSITTSSTDITVCALQDMGWTVSVCPHYATNHPPIANPQSITTDEDTPVSITLTGSDPDGDPLTFAISTPPTKGTLSALPSSAPYTVVFTPSPDANGSDSFTFTVSDGAEMSSATVTLTITPVNDAPTATDLSISAITALATNITLVGKDVDGDALTYGIVTNPTHGTLTGTGAALVYISNDGYIGADAFTYRVNDGTVNSAPATVSISVQTAPAASAASSSGGGGGSITYPWVVLFGALGARRLRNQRKQI